MSNIHTFGISNACTCMRVRINDIFMARDIKTILSVVLKHADVLRLLPGVLSKPLGEMQHYEQLMLLFMNVTNMSEVEIQKEVGKMPCNLEEGLMLYKKINRFPNNDDRDAMMVLGGWKPWYRMIMLPEM